MGVCLPMTVASRHVLVGRNKEGGQSRSRQQSRLRVARRHGAAQSTRAESLVRTLWVHSPEDVCVEIEMHWEIADPTLTHTGGYNTIALVCHVH